MSTDLNAFFKEHQKFEVYNGWKIRKTNPRITCADGFNLSVQARHTAYCEPRDDRGPWVRVEVGFPSAEPEFIMDHCEDPENPTGTVYGYVPIELVEKLIDYHGGMV
jgi:hypothetical protein